MNLPKLSTTIVAWLAIMVCCANSENIWIKVITTRSEFYEPGLEIARKHIMKTNLLGKHKLQFNYVRPGTTLILFLKQLAAFNMKHFLTIGPASSRDITLISPLVTENSMIQYNLNGLVNDFEDVNMYPYLFNFCVLFSGYERALTTFLHHHNWTRVAFIYISDTTKFSDTYYRSATSTEVHVRERGINVERLEKFSMFDDSTRANVPQWNRILKSTRDDNDLRIYVYFFNVLAMRYTLCELYKLGMYGPKYVHIVFHSKWFVYYKGFARGRTNCTVEQENIVLKNFVFMNRASKRDDDILTVANLTVGQINSEVKASFNKKFPKHIYPNEKLDSESLYYYDALWSFAKSINHISKKHPRFVDNFDNWEKNTTRLSIMTDAMSNLDFEGVTAKIKFHQKGNIRRLNSNIDFKKYDGNSSTTKTGKVNTTLMDVIGDDGNYVDRFRTEWEFPIPLDAPKIVESTKEYGETVLIIIWLFAGAGILLCLIFLTINIYYRQVDFIKLSSPNINNLICVGGIVTYISIFLGGLDTTIVDVEKVPLFCNISIVVLSVGFTLTFGSLFSKTWRIYRIFTKKNSIRSVVIRDTHLFGVVMVLLLIDFAMFVCFLAIAPYHLQAQVIDEKLIPSEDIILKTIINRCTSDHQNWFLGAMFFYKGLLMLFGLFLAYETKNIKVESINDSKYIGFAVYNVSLFATLGSIVFTSLYNTEHYRASYIVFCVCIIQSTTVTLCLIFGPKVWNILKDYKDPNFHNGRPVIPGQHYTNSNSHSMKSGSQSQSDANKEMESGKSEYSSEK
ncbi:gamma-aminobutyric acid type B receptor subunit 2-like [Clytia hemisphaerica]|uniref:G-protein coupled receptors family 3 profile domain-containing protein n=2 Tax=Clytia hemisphaerica TaxID=252671 RepID=A0A7M5TWN1_9CNID|eukprot:TCONS_00006587-protein